MESFDISAALQNMSKNALRLEIAGDSGSVVGRFGGAPDVPPDFVWPVFRTTAFDDPEVKPRPLSFLAQFDCAALALMDTEGLLPAEGVLSFFYELGSEAWGFNPEDAGCARVFWFPDRSALAPAAFPQELEEDYRLPSFEIRAHSETQYPDFEDFSLAFPSVAHPAHWQQTRGGWDGFCDEFEQAYEALQNNNTDSRHQLLGWPTIIQNNMTCECELVRRGHYLGGSWKDVPKADVREAEQNSLQDWQLLFQLDSVELDDFCLDFGDCGSIYFYIRRDDLAARNFEQTWLILQCY
ncbi:MAG: DUF1963 domain-containing protein [Lachnospiraceae bacterium]|nr:DUF1963 domain-containing protein [Lachnospiraceae bacterium]